jgi:protein tyrosine phosphatase (PTP) superfamily phosphohydrolase (DUF442 family)
VLTTIADSRRRKRRKNQRFLLYRGAQPRGEGYEELKKLGVSIVVDLRNSKPVKRDGGETREQVKVETAGTRYVENPASAFLGPTQSQVATFLQLPRDNQNKKVFVHCYFGADHTGVRWSPTTASQRITGLQTRITAKCDRTIFTNTFY